MRSASSWIVLKFGGSSVSSLENWRNIAHVVRMRRDAGARVLLVHSALSGVTDRLEELLDAAEPRERQRLLDAIEESHRRLARELAIPISAELARQFAELRQIAAEIARGAPGDLDRRPRDVQRQSTLDAHRATPARTALRRGAGDRE
jgi:bifunctional diaminopimelate decarboxylase / aspartate kinase